MSCSSGQVPGHRNLAAQSFTMRFFTLASLSFLAVLVSAQTSKTDAATTNELLAELTKLPTCVVRIAAESAVHWIRLTGAADHMHNVIIT